MIVRCISNLPEKAIKTQKYRGRSSGNNSDKYLLTVGELYAVYAVFKMPNKGKLYLIMDDANPTYEEIKAGNAYPDPVSYDSNLFEVIITEDDNWVIGKGTPFTFWGTTISFPAFAKSRNYYEKLLNEESSTLDMFFNQMELSEKQIRSIKA